jgi:hypothetical protein
MNWLDAQRQFTVIEQRAVQRTALLAVVVTAAMVVMVEGLAEVTARRHMRPHLLLRQ